MLISLTILDWTFRHLRDKSFHCQLGWNRNSAEQTKLFSPVLFKSDMLSPSYMSPTPCPLNQTSARTRLTLLNCCWSAAGGAVDVVARVLWTGREPGSAVPWGTTPSGPVSVSPPPSSVRGHWVTQHIGCMATWSPGLTPAVTSTVDSPGTWDMTRGQEKNWPLRIKMLRLQLTIKSDAFPRLWIENYDPIVTGRVLTQSIKTNNLLFISLRRQ